MRDYIKANEGLRLKVYTCQAGKASIGYGRNLQDRGISMAEAEMLFEDDFAGAVQAVQDLVPEFDYLSAGRQKALVDMAFNLGKGGFQKFKKMLDAVRRREWDEAAKHLEDSLYYYQLPNRAKKNQELIRNG